MKRVQRWWGNLKLLNPKNLEKEVHVYGYHFSWKSHILLILCSLFGIGAIGILFQLKPLFLAVTVAAVVIMLPVFVLNMYKKMYEQKRFSDVVTYMEQMLYAYQKSGKVIRALKEVREVFEDGQMRETLERAVSYLEQGKAATEKGVLREALEIIEKPYMCAKICSVHELLVSGEEYGGDMENSILLLLEDIELWKRRGYRLQAEKKTSHTDNIISILVSTVLCAVALYVLDAMSRMFPGAALEKDIFQVPLIQVSSLLFLLAMLLVLAKSFRRLSTDWLKEDGTQPKEYILSSYHTVLNYDEPKERRKSILFAAPFVVAAVPLFLFLNKWVGIGCVLAAAFMLIQHRVGYNLAKRDVNQELYITLPQWLMELALLMQNNNVQVSIAKSVEGAPVVLKEELKKLLERIQKEPDKLSSYTGFCQAFDVPEAQSCMKMLHAISESGTGNAKVQINNLLHRVNEMQNMADQIQGERTAFQMKMIFSYPILGATVKLLVDLTFGMIFMFQLLGSMGGGL